MLISPQLQNSFYQEVQAPQAASTAVTHTSSQAVAGRGHGPAAGAVQGLCRAGHSRQDFLCHRISQHPSVKEFCCQADDEVPWAVTQGPTSSCV